MPRGGLGSAAGRRTDVAQTVEGRRGAALACRQKNETWKPASWRRHAAAKTPARRCATSQCGRPGRRRASIWCSRSSRGPPQPALARSQARKSVSADPTRAVSAALARWRPCGWLAALHSAWRCRPATAGAPHARLVSRPASSSPAGEGPHRLGLRPPAPNLRWIGGRQGLRAAGCPVPSRAPEPRPTAPGPRSGDRRAWMHPTCSRRRPRPPGKPPLPLPPLPPAPAACAAREVAASRQRSRAAWRGMARHGSAA